MIQITINHIHRGNQLRSYGPHVWKSEFIFTGESKFDMPVEDTVKFLAKSFVTNFTEDKPDGSMSDHFRPRLRECAKVEDDETKQRWIVEIQEPFCD